MSLWNNHTWTPMLLNEINKPFSSNNFLYEIKFDGTRSIIYANKNKITIYNRHHEDVTKLYPELQAIKNLVNKNTIFDGEIVYFENNKPSFSLLQKRMHLKNINSINYEAEHNPVVFMCFDILYLSHDLVNKTLLERKKILHKFKDNDYFIKTSYIEKNGISLFNEI